MAMRIAVPPEDSDALAAGCLRSEHWYATRRGTRVCVVRWRPKDPSAPPPRAVVMIAHGYTNYASALFDWLAAHLVARGIATVAVEAMGHGKSEGLPAFVPCFTDMVHDFADVAKTIRGPHESAWYAPSTPLFGYGESMGGAICIQAARGERSLFDGGLILMAPMVGVNDAEQPRWVMQVIGRLLSYVVPTAALTPLRDITAACFKDPERLPEARTDKVRYTGAMRIATAMSFMDTMGDIQTQGPAELHTPMVLYHGTGDLVTSPAASRALHEAAASSHKTFVSVEEGYHVLWWEARETRMRLFEHMLSWVEGRLAKPMASAVEVVTIPAAAAGSPFRGGKGDVWTPWTGVSHPEIYLAQNPDQGEALGPRS